MNWYDSKLVMAFSDDIFAKDRCLTSRDMCDEVTKGTQSMEA